MAKIPAIIREIQAMQVMPEEITYFVQQLAQQQQDRVAGDADFYTVVAMLAERYQGADQHRSFCVMERMRCLVHLMSDERMRGWTVKSIDEDRLFTNEAIFRATAKCPLHADATQVWFDADEFFQVALSETQPQARA
jgi:hypothetical protein